MLLLSGCSLNFPKEITVHCDNCGQPPTGPGTQPPTTPPVTPNLTYKAIKNSVLDVYCLKCHNGASGQGGVNLATYQATLDYVSLGKPPLDSKICKEVSDRSMPKDKQMPDQNITTICSWIEQGAKE